MTTRTTVTGGRFYGQRRAGAPWEPKAPGPPDAWICRRVADYAPAPIPAGGARGTCARCTAPIIFNPARVPSVPPDTPKVCMQCAGIEPLPFAP
jgi:hypothetical protein